MNFINDCVKPLNSEVVCYVTTSVANWCNILLIIHSKKQNYLAIEKKIKEVMKANNFIRTGSSPDMYENDTGLYHKTLEFAKERMEI